jgi:hypothetical protein
MHQEHNLPWNTVASHLEFVYDNPHYTPRKTGLFANRVTSATQDKDTIFFLRNLTSTISRFSHTERGKYPTQAYTLPMSGDLFPDEMCEKYPDYLNKGNQKIESWIGLARRDDQSIPPTLYYDTSHANLAEAVKILISENHIATLLMLAQHPLIPLHSLRNLSWGHHFGFSRVMEAALRTYLFFNVHAAVGSLNNGNYMHSQEYSSMLYELTRDFDYPAQQLPHREFFGQGGEVGAHLPPVHEDLAALREYIKMLFELLYRYDVVVRECGVDPDWESSIAHNLRRLAPGIRMKME